MFDAKYVLLEHQNIIDRVYNLIQMFSSVFSVYHRRLLRENKYVGLPNFDYSLLSCDAVYESFGVYVLICMV
jgi:hypothetical protein